MPERFPPMDVGDVHLDHAGARPGDGVVQRHAGVRVGGRIQHHANRFTCRLSPPGLLNPIDELTLAVGLAELQAPAQLVRHLQAGMLDIGQGRLAVDVGFTHPKQIEVRAVETYAEVMGYSITLRVSEIAHRRTDNERAEA